MPIAQLGQLNVAALQAPGVYVQIVPPPREIQGVPTDIIGMVGVGSWGPVNSPILAVADTFGPVTVRKYDLASAIAISAQFQSMNIRGVRVSDGTDTAAAANIVDVAGSPVTGLILTAIYTGTVGNTLSAAVSAGTKPSTSKLTINRVGYTSEVYDNISGSGAALWQAMLSAVNNGQFGLRGPSGLCVATLGSSSVAPATVTVSFTGGTDGASSVTDATLVGSDGTTPSARHGMYALRSSGAQLGNLIDLTDSTQWPNIAAFGINEGVYIPLSGAVGASYATVATALATAGVDSYAIKPLVGDWVYWQDNVSGQLRLMSPATFAAAKLAALAPHLSTLNKSLAAVVGTQRTSQNQPYSSSEIAAIVQSRLDVIVNPSVGGPYFGFATGQNASSNPATNGDNYTRMTNFLSLSLLNAMGYVVGQPQTTDLRLDAEAAIDNFLSGLEKLGMIGDVNGGPAFSVQINADNNPSDQVALGYMFGYVKVVYLSIVKFFVINLEGGQTVTITPVDTQPA